MEVGAYAAVQSVPDIGREKPTRSKRPLSEQPRAFARILYACITGNYLSPDNRKQDIKIQMKLRRVLICHLVWEWEDNNIVPHALAV